MAREFYDNMSGDYDQMMNWEGRLIRERPFFENLFADHGIKSVLDVACGTGRHCLLFSELGAERVVGADPSKSSLEIARRKAPVGGKVQFIEASYADIADKLHLRFDLVSTLGNSISHLLAYDDLVLGLNNMRRLLDDGGLMLVQLLNWEERLAAGQRFFPPHSSGTPEGQKLFFRFFDFHDELVTMNLLIFQTDNRQNSQWSTRNLSTTLRPWRSEVIRMALRDCGLELVSEYGSLDMSPFELTKSPDYIFTARRG